MTPLPKYCRLKLICILAWLSAGAPAERWGVLVEIPVPSLSQALIHSHSPNGDGWPPHHPIVLSQPELWKDSGGPGPICHPTLKLIPFTLCLMAPYLACLGNGDPHPLCPVPIRLSAAINTNTAYHSEQVMNDGIATGRQTPSSQLVWKATIDTKFQLLEELFRDASWVP